jgi:hypothetical protein
MRCDGADGANRDDCGEFWPKSIFGCPKDKRAGSGGPPPIHPHEQITLTSADERAKNRWAATSHPNIQRSKSSNNPIFRMVRGSVAPRTYGSSLSLRPGCCRIARASPVNLRSKPQPTLRSVHKGELPHRVGHRVCRLDLLVSARAEFITSHFMPPISSHLLSIRRRCSPEMGHITAEELDPGSNPQFQTSRNRPRQGASEAKSRNRFLPHQTHPIEEGFLKFRGFQFFGRSAPRDRRPQDPHLDGTGVQFETLVPGRPARQGVRTTIVTTCGAVAWKE